MFKKLLASVGVGGAEVETELHTPGVQPGGTVHGVIRLKGGGAEQDITRVAVEFVTRVELEHTEEEQSSHRGFHRTDVHGPLRLPPGALYDIPFGLYTPLEAPITFYNGRHLPGMAVSVRTIVEIAGAVDTGDSDPIGIGALPAQHVILSALEQLGLPLRSADCEWGGLRGIRQELPFYQEIEFGASYRYPRLNQLEVTFVARPDGMDVILEGDKKGSWYSEGSDVYDVLFVDYNALSHVDWTAVLDQRLAAMASRGH
ncbi:sporulation protein [Nocardia huaxiensis]|uniref:Sporulation protein n=1 Tax=Nocardia huaxiensis TaxID=2755382 RepID=A0A7D6Z338_9NOCA|nr:sporulation protein [Nocardia huaxiensis]QLY29744.1 sporulation protein [Nocardia huaxiensis]UFS96671.1 sporulation protein [Nocardia huaxiensis]